MPLWTKTRIIVVSILGIFLINLITTFVVIKHVSFNELNKKSETNSIQSNNISKIVKDSVITVVAGIDIKSGYRTDDLLVGSAFIYDDNLAVTNYHIIKEKSFYVIDSNDKAYNAKLVAFDAETDIALLKVLDADLHKKVTFECENNFTVGEKVYAIGTPLYPALNNTVVEGFISGVNRTGLHECSLIQSSIPSSPGMSGSPLINSKGNIIGLNTFQLSEYGSNAITLSIPSDVIQAAIKGLKNNEKITPYTGLVINENEYPNYGLEKYKGIFVEAVLTNSPANNAKIKHGDRIIEVNKKEINSKAEFSQIISELYRNGITDITIKVIRQNVKMKFILTGLMTEKISK